MNVAIIEPVGGHGGMDYYDFGLANGLTEAGCRVTVYTCDETNVPDGAVFDCKLTFRDVYGAKNKIIRGVNFLRGLLASLLDAKRRGSCIVHLHFFHAGALELLSSLAVKVFGFKLIVTVHDVESFSGEGSAGRARHIFGLADHIVAHNQISIDELVEKVGIPADCVERIPHGNYMQQAAVVPRLETARLRLGISDDRQVILFFGQIKKVKGLDLLLQAFAGIRQQHPDALLVIAGKVWKDDFLSYQQLIDSSGIADAVRLDIRYISDEDARLYYASADVVVLPYRKIYQSGVLLMAMSFKRLVLVSNLKGMTEIVEDGVNGLVFQKEDVDSLSRKLSLALSSGDREVMAGRGQALMLNQYGWNAIGVQTKLLYEDVLSPEAKAI